MTETSPGEASGPDRTAPADSGTRDDTDRPRTGGPDIGGDGGDLAAAMAALAPQLADTRWRHVEVVESTGSTNADLIARAAESDIEGTVRITTDQTAGRGRHQRVWAAPAGGQLAMSVAFAVRAGSSGTRAAAEPSAPEGRPHTDELGWLSLLTGLSAAAAIEECTGVRPVLKWPNDVLVDDRKVAGILAEYAGSVDGGVAVVGIGINTDMTADELPVDTATSLRLATGAPVDTAALATAYLRALSEWRWPLDGAAAVEAYRHRSDTLGRRVRLTLPGGTEVVGTAVDIDPDGRIVVESDGGERTVAAAGDVVHLRPVDGG
ncbi:biotin--[acetyl-CoA-carboxylase] ligase [Gordonia sinesedis]